MIERPSFRGGDGEASDMPDGGMENDKGHQEGGQGEMVTTPKECFPDIQPGDMKTFKAVRVHPDEVEWMVMEDGGEETQSEGGVEEMKESAPAGGDSMY